MLTRPHYGWVAFVTYSPVPESEAQQRFYRRSGKLLGLFYALGTTDVHYENIIAAGEHPVFIDTETLITPSLAEAQAGETAGFPERQVALELYQSVLATAMLPIWKFSANGEAFDTSALGATGGLEVEAAVWQNIGTDAVERQMVRSVSPRNHNIPFTEEQSADVSPFAEQVVEGFREMYTLLLAQQNVLLAVGGPLEELASSPMRLVFRDTQTYFTILKNSLDARFLRDGVERCIELELLSRVVGVAESHQRFIGMITAEQQAILNLDIPFFTIAPKSCVLEAAEAVMVEGAIPQPPFDEVCRRVRQFSPHDLERQISIIRGAFTARLLSRNSHTAQLVKTAAGAKPAEDPASLVEEALSIARTILAHARSGSDGSITWVAPNYHMSARIYQYSSLNAGLFDGLGGVSLFLAAVHKVTGDKPAMAAALQTLPTAQRALAAYEVLQQSGKRYTSVSMNLGAASGLGSIVYCYARIGQWLHSEECIAVAMRAAALITPSLIDADEQVNLMRGSAARF